jgi:hypothetical protein
VKRAIIVAALLWPGTASAQDLWTVDDPAPVRVVARDEPTKPIPSKTETPAGLGPDPAFAHLVDPSLPAPLHAATHMGAAYATTDSATRPLAADTRRGGWVNDLGLELAMHERIGVEGAFLLTPPKGAGSSASWAGRAGLRVLITDPSSRTLRVAIIGGTVRDFAEVAGPFGEVTATWDVGRLRIGSLLHGEKMLADGRDSVDIVGALGASMRVLDILRVGAEYVGQDFEDAWEPEEAEGGTRHFAGATVALALRDDLRLVGGPAIGLTEASPQLLGRASLSYWF